MSGKESAVAKAKRFNVEDPAGEEWQTAANEAWVEAQRRSEESGRAAVDHWRGYIEVGPRGKETKHDGLATALPDFREMVPASVKGEVMGRFLYHPDTDLVHDLTKATPACEVQRTPRSFIHFAHEIEGAVSPKAKAHAACMG